MESPMKTWNALTRDELHRIERGTGGELVRQTKLALHGDDEAALDRAHKWAQIHMAVRGCIADRTHRVH